MNTDRPHASRLPAPLQCVACRRQATWEVDGTSTCDLHVRDVIAWRSTVDLGGNPPHPTPPPNQQGSDGRPRPPAFFPRKGSSVTPQSAHLSTRSERLLLVEERMDEIATTLAANGVQAISLRGLRAVMG